MQSPERGGIASFLGVVRAHHQGRAVLRLDYSAYHEMAEAECARVVAEAETRWPVKVALQHRIGTLEVGEVAVVVVAAGAHRDEAFAACRHVIEELKRRVPIWKREHFADGQVDWVGAARPGAGAGMSNGTANPPADRLGRPMGSLRLSVTDRCNMRCRYCMPEEEYRWLPRASILSFEELARLTAVFATLGAGKVRLTGGEPLLRHDLPELVRKLAAVDGVRDLALTTNGILLGARAAELRAAGLGRVTVSLDTLRPERMAEFARSDRHADVLSGSRGGGLGGLRLGQAQLGRHPRLQRRRDPRRCSRSRGAQGVELRYIEYMDVGGATRWSRDQVVSQRDILAVIEAAHGPAEPLPARAAAPAERFRLADGTVFGVIASTTAPFCRDCDRSRLTADGTWYLCLYATDGINLRDVMRGGATDAELTALIRDRWGRRTDRGAEQRLAVPERGVLYQVETLRADPRREMHTRGG